MFPIFSIIARHCYIPSVRLILKQSLNIIIQNMSGMTLFLHCRYLHYSCEVEHYNYARCKHDCNPKYRRTKYDFI